MGAVRWAGAVGPHVGVSARPGLMSVMSPCRDPRPADGSPVDPAAQGRWLSRRLSEVPGGVVLLTGAPGTGKTTAALAAVQAQVGDDIPVDGALLLAPTRVAAGRLRGALGAVLGETHTEPLVRTPSSLAYAVLRAAAAGQGLPEPRLLTGAEQDAILRELLRGHALGDSPGPDWPADLAGALGTVGFRDQLRELLMRAVEHGVDPDQLATWGRLHDRPEWSAAAQVMHEYDQVSALASPGAYDPAWICAAAAQIVETEPQLAESVVGRIRLLVLDDAQELTASAARLVAAVHRCGLRVLVVGDPDSVVQGFRGAAPERFVQLARELAARTSGASPAEVVLRHHHRQRSRLAAVTARVAERIGVSSGGAHRGPAVVCDDPGTVEVVAVHTAAQEAAYVAQALRVAHLRRHVPWSQMAVVARSGAAQEAIRRALGAASVPVHPGPGSLPVRADPATRPLLLAYDVVLGWVDGSAPALDAAQAVELVTSFLGGADPVALRRLRRALSRAAVVGTPGDEVLTPETMPPSADEILAGSLLDPTWLSDPAVAGAADLLPARRLARILHAGVEILRDEEKQDAHQLLWALWSASGVARHWERQALAGGPAGTRADRQLDAMVVLFGAAQDFVSRSGPSDPRGFLEHVAGQDVLSDSLVARAHHGEAVEVLTPFASAGREWHTVAVVGVQEGVWPDLRLRDTLLGAGALVEVVHDRPINGAAGVRAAHSQVLADETRQFHVAVSRAGTHLLVTAVSSTDDQPSAFLGLVDPDFDSAERVHVPPAPTLRSLVAGLRRDAVRAHRAGRPAERDRCADLLAILADQGVRGADPTTWWDARNPSTYAARVAEGPVRLSPSKVQAFSECSLRWLLTSHGGDTAGAVASSVGTLVHGVLAEDPGASASTLKQSLGERWPRLRMPDSWVADRELSRAEAMIDAFVTYRAAASSAGRELVAVELSGEVQVGRALVAGQIDRLERDAEGGYVVVDLKTGSSKPRRDEVASHPQLGAYQVAVLEGAFAAVTGPGPTSGGAALAHLGKQAVITGEAQRQPPLQTSEDPTWAHDLLRRSADGMAATEFPATIGDWCRTCTVRRSCPLQPEGDQQ